MNTADKHYKFINCRTGYVIFYYSLSAVKPVNELKAELEKIRAQVAIQNSIYQGTVYWEEIRDDDKEPDVS